VAFCSEHTYERRAKDQGKGRHEKRVSVFAELVMAEIRRFYGMVVFINYNEYDPARFHARGTYQR
jgi:hypothetical protein